MTELINTENSGEFPISGRALHKRLEVGTPYEEWFPRMCEYGFVEGQDFSTNVSASTGNLSATDHSLTLSMVKELCMLQRTDKGREVRRYMFAVVDQWNQPDALIARALQMANRKLETLAGSILHLESASSEVTVGIEADASRVRFAESVEGDDSSRLTGTLARLFR